MRMQKVILFQGDSITDAKRDYESDEFSGNGYATMVKGELGCKAPGQYVFYNRGIGGSRVVDIYARLKRDILNLKPDYLSLLIGVNDVWQEIDGQDGVESERFKRILAMLLDDITAQIPQVKILLLEPFVLEGPATENRDTMPNRWELFLSGVREHAEAVRQVAQERDLPVVYLQDRLEQAAKTTGNGYWLYDGVHPTAMGHTLIKNAWMETFETRMAT